MRTMWIVFWIVVVALLAATSTVGYLAFHAPTPDKSTPMIECIKAVLLCIGGAGVIISTYFTAVNAFSQRQANVIKNTFDLLTRWDDPHLFNARKWTRRVKETADSTSKNQLLADIAANEDLKNSVILVLNYFEHVRFSLHTKRIDKKLFKASLGETIANIAERFTPYAETLSAETAKDLQEVVASLK